MNFFFPQHQRIITLLNSFDSNLLQISKAYFGGGTLIALRFGEFRESKDVDFICPIRSGGYKKLRSLIFEEGYQALFKDLSRIRLGRSTTDQYGIRMTINVEDYPLKTEIISEARFELDPPLSDEWAAIPCLNLNDCFTSKLLANADRYLDNLVQSRDLIDLAVLRLISFIPDEAIAKAENAYEVIRPLKRSIQSFQERPEYREECFTRLKIEESNIPQIIEGIDLLAADLGLEKTERTFKEQEDLFLLEPTNFIKVIAQKQAEIQKEKVQRPQKRTQINQSEQPESSSQPPQKNQENNLD